jgi:immune inhibitor A
MKINKYIAIISLAALGLILHGGAGFAMPPHPDLLNNIENGTIPMPAYLKMKPQLAKQGVDNATASNKAGKISLAGNFRALAVLIEFSDKANSVNAEEFDTLIFTDQQSTVRSYYNDVSYGQLDIITVNLPSAIGWTTAPQTYAYYCNGNNGTGSYPYNTQKLCEDIVDIINAQVNFGDYDNDLDGYVDALILIHSGPGAEFTGSDNDIWSHQWAIVPRLRDGVYISGYCIQPEYWQTPGDITCGVYCHELGHVFGLPDLYDTDNDSYGVGKWSVMGYGSWNGPTGMGDYPAFLDAWSRIQLGFAEYSNVASNTTGASIPRIEDATGIVYRLWSSGGLGNEYFLVENRQKTGYDSYIPYSGLLIWHIDETQDDNDNQWYPGHESSGNYLVALEQADGLYQLEKAYPVGNSGNAGDPFPGSAANNTFSALSTPNSNSYDGDNTYVAVSNISASAATMTADFQVSLSSGGVDPEENLLPKNIYLSQNYPNPFNSSTIIHLNIPETAQLSITVFDILGRSVRHLWKGEPGPGEINLEWDGTDDIGNSLPSGIYFYRLEYLQGDETRKMVLLK